MKIFILSRILGLALFSSTMRLGIALSLIIICIEKTYSQEVDFIIADTAYVPITENKFYMKITWKHVYDGTVLKSNKKEVNSLYGIFQPFPDEKYFIYAGSKTYVPFYAVAIKPLDKTKAGYFSKTSPDGKLLMEGYKIRGKLNGELRVYDKENCLLEVETYKNNILNGPFACFYLNGNLRYCGIYLNGKKNLKWKLYREDGYKIE